SGGGIKIPIKDVIRMGGHANHHLAVFDEATGAALAYFRARRIASPAQRIMLIARDGGCTKPCCTVGAYGSQVHHAVTDWADGGNTNVDEMALACGPDNRLVHTDGGYRTTINDRGEVEWHPPPALEHGQTRINYHHRPELLLTPPDEKPAPEQERAPEPTRERALKREPTQNPDPEMKPGPQPQPEPKPNPELEREPGPDLEWDHEWDLPQDPERELEWDLQWDNDFDQSTPIPPNVEHLWDPQPSDPDPDPGLPPGWILLDWIPGDRVPPNESHRDTSTHDHPDPWQPNSDHALTGKGVRGP
ncbi:DUF222 domain-containing protein, partial [Mycolicibacterium boenickei]